MFNLNGFLKLIPMVQRACFGLGHTHTHPKTRATPNDLHS